jgi:hypothetical protein
MGHKLVVCGSLYHIHRRYKEYFRSSKWKISRVQEWDDGTHTYVFEYIGRD